MKSAAIVLAVGTMLTVEQRDANRLMAEHASVAVSADGRFVAFTTYSQLVPADTDKASDVYVLDRERQHVTLESADTAGFVGDASHPGISGDGRHVVFERANGVMLRDRRDGVTKLIAEGRQPVITDAGHLVVFTESSADRVTGDVNGNRTDIYVADVHGAQVRRVSVGMPGLDLSLAASVQPSASRDGRFIAFTSRAQVQGTRPEPRVFVRDTERNVTMLVGAGWDPSISGDGHFVAFVGLHNRLPHIFQADLQTGTSRIITNSVRRGLANGASGKPKFSPDGRFIVFQSEASDLVAGEDFNLLWDVFVFDRVTGTTVRVSGDADGGWMEPSGGPSIDARGSVVAFSSRHPTDVSDKRNDFDLYVATMGTLDAEPQRRRVSSLKNSLRLIASANGRDGKRRTWPRESKKERATVPLDRRPRVLLPATSYDVTG
jgi:Tol biopolymer transport system component